MTIRVLVVDDHPLFRDGIAALLATAEGIALVGSAPDAETALELVATADVDVVLMDLNLPSMPGVEATARISALTPAPAVLVVTMVDDDDTVVAALRAGARGYVLKGAPGNEVLDAIRAVAAGAAVFGAGVAAQVLALTSSAPRPTSAPVPGQDDLTEREREVLSLLAEGASNAQIARRLGLSLKTIQNYVSRILEKLQLADRTQAALHAREHRYRD
ncbi:MAG TPA: response regulator transcription factor [Mycobacteriales bacterium]|nr:response regulator transcription factor [Mycobacteriales bacterium]